MDTETPTSEAEVEEVDPNKALFETLSRKRRRTIEAAVKRAKRRRARAMHRQLRQMRLDDGEPAWRPESWDLS